MNLLDRAVAWFSPEAGARRQAWREFSANGLRSGYRSRIDVQSKVSGHPDAINELSYDREAVLERGRELERDNALAAALLDRYVENVVGTGFKLRMKSGDKAWDQAVEAAWAEWSANADVRGIDSFPALCRLVARSYKRDGDVLVVKVARGPGKGRLQLVEADQLRSPPGQVQSSARMVSGVELDPVGAPTAFHVISGEYDRQTLSRQGQPATTVIPAKNAVFLAQRKRANQTRGVSTFGQIAWVLEQIDKLLEAVIVSTRMAACFGVVVEKPGGFPGLSTVTGGDGRNYKNMSFEPGMWKVLDAGEKINTLNPSQPQQNLGEFVRLVTQLAGTAFAFPLELVLMDFTRTNYSSARAAFLQAWQAFSIEQQVLQQGFCDNVLAWKIEDFVREGKVPARALDAVALKHTWVPPGKGWVDKVKEIQADQLAVDAGFETVSQVLAQHGYDFDEYVEVRAKEIEDLEAAGIPVQMSNMSRSEVPEQPEEEAMPEDGGGAALKAALEGLSR